MQGVSSEANFSGGTRRKWGQDTGKGREGAVMSRLTLRLISPGDPAGKPVRICPRGTRDGSESEQFYICVMASSTATLGAAAQQLEPACSRASQVLCGRKPPCMARVRATVDGASVAP